MFYSYLFLFHLSGVQCATVGPAGWSEGSGMEGSGMDVDFGEENHHFTGETNIGTETYGDPTLKPADFNDANSGILFSQALDVRLCLVEILDVIETKRILSDWMMTVVESVLPGKWINISINVKINEFNSDQSVASKNALLEISLSGEYHDSLVNEGERTPEFLDLVIFDMQEAIDFVVLSGSSPSSNVTINPECRPTFSTSNLSILSSEVQTSTTDNMITYPFEDLDKTSLSTDTVTDISTSNADKTDYVSTSANRDDPNLPSTDVYPISETKPASQTPKVENIEDSPILSSASPSLDNILSWETTKEDETTPAMPATNSDSSYIFNLPTTDSEITLPTTESIPEEILSTKSATIKYETSTNEQWYINDYTVITTINGSEYFTEVDDRPTTASISNKDISAIPSLAATAELFALTKDVLTTSASITDEPLQTTSSLNRVYYLSEPRKLRILT